MFSEAYHDGLWKWSNLDTIRAETGRPVVDRARHWMNRADEDDLPAFAPHVDMRREFSHTVPDVDA